MAELTVTVAIPTLDAGSGFAETVAAVGSQQLGAGRAIELLVCDSGSVDDTRRIARDHGARVLEIPRREFSHGGTRNLLMARSAGAHVAFLTQDSVPAGPHWLERLLTGFALAPRVGLVFGPYRPRPDASPMVACELVRWFASLSPDGEPRVDALEPGTASAPAARAFLGARGFFTDANGCVARTAWERAPFRPVAYAEDHLLAQDMLRAGFAKVYIPGAEVIHSHEYSAWQWLRRSFDEARGVREVYGEVPGAGLREALLAVRGGVGGDVRWVRAGAGGSARVPATVPRSAVHHGARALGRVLGARAEGLPSSLTSKLSLESRR